MSRGILAVMDDLPTHTVQEYVIIEEHSVFKHEYDDGQVRAMSGGTAEHARLAAEVIFQLKTQLVGRACSVFTSDLRVRVSATGLITYPDVSVFCGELTADSEDKLAQRNPIVLVEVASKSTEKYDRVRKFEHYKRIPALREYVCLLYTSDAADE